MWDHLRHERSQTRDQQMGGPGGVQSVANAFPQNRVYPLMRKGADSLPTVGVVGCGAMGTGIAQVAASGGFETILFDSRVGAATAAKEEIRDRWSRRIATGKLSARDAERALGRIGIVENLTDLHACDVVIEAILENLDAKRDLFAQLESIVDGEAILASNTSSLSISAIAAGLTGPSRVAGMHFFNPVPVMKLVEVIPGVETVDSAVGELRALAGAMGHTPIVVKDTPGFLVNFGGRAFTTEALAILHEGIASPTQIDAVMRDCWGFRMGPFQLMDLTGIDVNFPVTRFVYDSYFGDPRFKSIPLHRQMFESGDLGRKTGKGFYDYSADARVPSPDAQATGRPADAVVLCERNIALKSLLTSMGAQVLEKDDGERPIVGAPVGEDCAAYCARTGADHRRFVAVDLTGQLERRVTLMTPPDADERSRQSVVDLFARDRAVTVIGDSPGFIAQRIIAMVANLGCELAQMGIAAPEDIDRAMRLGLNYPCGPLELTDKLSPAVIYSVLWEIQRLSGDDRYRPSSWLRRRAMLSLSARTQ